MERTRQDLGEQRGQTRDARGHASEHRAPEWPPGEDCGQQRVENKGRGEKASERTEAVKQTDDDNSNSNDDNNNNNDTLRGV